ncbi:unnamed protein product [Thlaspi arvense]|uniref:PUM-HD domain-containing protein n=1 Tax=Thlaspi arvense TaxID=13288 RepID=A0AAU9RJL5_THLAR|nr:unnamed protein product [Thlaspi arvense]
MEKMGDKLAPHSRYVQRLMTSSEKVDMDEFRRIVFLSDELPKFANALTSDLDLFVNITSDEVGLNRIMRILGISDNINTILFYPIMMRFTEIMTHDRGRGQDLASRILNVCNIHHKKQFCQITYRHALVLAPDENGCAILKQVITEADEFFKDEFLQLITEEAYSLCMYDLGISLIEHVLKLDFTLKTTQDDTLLHELMAEFDELLSTPDDDRLHKLASKLTSDSDLFVEFVKTRRGSLMAQIILGKSEEIDTGFLAAIKQRFTDVTTDFYAYRIMVRAIYVFKKRGNLKVCNQILRLVGVHALYLTKDPHLGSAMVEEAVDLHNLDCTAFIASGLHCHYIEIAKCDQATLVRLANDEHGNKVLKKAMEVAKEHRVDFFGDIAEKFKPFLDNLRGSLGENIAAIIDSEETETVKDRIVSQGNA